MEFRDFLLNELARRQKSNPVFSQRAFARFLSVDNSRLSKMLRGERPIGEDFIESFGNKLGLKQEQIRHFVQNSQSPPRRRRAKFYKQISKDHFQIISDWRHYAILELMKLPSFKREAGWIAKVLKTTPLVIQDCLNRLQRVGLLEISKRGHWRDSSRGFSTDILGPNVATQAHRANQNEFLRLAQAALLDTPMEVRDQSSMMMVTSQKKIAQAKEKIKKFRRELCEFLESGDEKNEVFLLSISLFPLTDLRKGSSGE